MKIFYLFCINGLLLLASCGIQHNTYIAPLPNVPMFEAKKDVNFNVALSPTHVEFQGALAVTNHLGITAGRFYSGAQRNSSELGINLYTKSRVGVFYSATFGCGNTKNEFHYYNPVFTKSANSDFVNYKSLFFHPGVYYIFDDADNKIRVGLSVKYALSRITNYYSRTYRNYNFPSDLIDETIITAPNQNFNALTPMLSAEFKRGVFTVGGHAGIIFTSKIKANYSYTNYTEPSLSKKEAIKEPFQYWPLMASFYVGIRL